MHTGGGGTEGRAVRKEILMSNWEKCVLFDTWFARQENTHYTQDISTEWASLLWAVGSRRAAVKGKKRKNMSLVHQELRGQQSL